MGKFTALSFEIDAITNSIRNVISGDSYRALQKHFKCQVSWQSKDDNRYCCCKYFDRQVF
jgi:hypothetical protein